MGQLISKQKECPEWNTWLAPNQLDHAHLWKFPYRKRCSNTRTTPPPLKYSKQSIRILVQNILNMGKTVYA